MIELNKVFLSARLTRDPEMRYIPSGAGVCEMRVAADRSFSDRNSAERRTETLFINVTAWGKTAEFCNQYMNKGSAIFVEGRLKLDSWDDRETGKKREKISIVADRVQFGESRAEAEARRQGGGGGGRDYGDDNYGSGGGGGRDSDPPPQASGGGGGGDTADDLPF